MGSNPVEASEFFLGFLCNCLSYFTTAKITFTSILYPQLTHMSYKLHNEHTHAFLWNCSSLFQIVSLQSVSRLQSILKSMCQFENVSNPPISLTNNPVLHIPSEIKPEQNKTIVYCRVTPFWGKRGRGACGFWFREGIAISKLWSNLKLFIRVRISRKKKKNLISIFQSARSPPFPSSDRVARRR